MRALNLEMRITSGLALRTLRLAVAVAGISLVILALVADAVGLGSAGFGPAQSLLLLVGIGIVVMAAVGKRQICEAFIIWASRGLLGFVLLIPVLTFLHFPVDVDDPLNRDNERTAELFYEDSYTPSTDGQNSKYVEVAREAAEHANVNEEVARFVEEYHLKEKRVLEIGAGSGTLQDLVEDYTGLDIAESARRFFHKPFVHGSATALPFEEAEFDAIWTIWVLEHVPNPERALAEMRRVLKHKGLIYLAPAWNCFPWAAEGCNARPYGELDWSGKIIKASIPVMTHGKVQLLHRIPTRALRLAYASWISGPTRLRYRKLDANFDNYWEADSDAINSIDSHEALLWFTSRGDQCLNCKDGFSSDHSKMIIEVNKPPARGADTGQLN